MTDTQIGDDGLSATAPAEPRSFLMCPPRHFDVTYQINPWMRPELSVDTGRALEQWTGLRDTLIRLGHHVVLMPPQPDLPDLVFTANGGIVIGDRALVPRFRYEQRAPEAEHFAAALTELNLDVQLATQVNEGEGDFRVIGQQILAGYGLRSDRPAVDEVEGFFGLPVVPLRLVDERFYHLDTALAVLDENTVAYLPQAFDGASRARLKELYPDAITASESEAALLGLNMVSDGQTVIMAPGCSALAADIAERGFQVIELNSDELRKAGGGVKCCVLELHPAASQPGSVDAPTGSSEREPVLRSLRPAWPPSVRRITASRETFSVMTKAPEGDHASCRLTAQGALTGVGGEVLFEAVTSLLKAGVCRMTLDLSAVTSVADEGLRWLRRAWLQTEAAGGRLWTVGVPEAQRAAVPTSHPCLAGDAAVADDI